MSTRRFIVQAAEHVGDEYVADYFEADVEKDRLTHLILQLIKDSTASGIIEFIRSEYKRQDEENLPDEDTVGVVINILDALTSDTLVQVLIPYSHSSLDLVKSRCSISRWSDAKEFKNLFTELANAISAASLQ